LTKEVIAILKGGGIPEARAGMTPS